MENTLDIYYVGSILGSLELFVLAPVLLYKDMFRESSILLWLCQESPVMETWWFCVYGV